MAVIETWLKQDLQELVHVKCLTGNLFSLDNGGNLIGVEVTDNGELATLAGTVTANAILADGSTVAITGGTLSGNKVSVVLPQACYTVLGNITIAIKLSYSGTVTTLGCVIGVVYRSSTDTPVDPGTVIPSIQQLITEIEALQDIVPADLEDLWTTLAPNYTQTTYVIGQYCTHDGVLYRCKTAITQGEEFTSSHWTAANIGEDLRDIIRVKRSVNDSGCPVVVYDDWENGNLSDSTGNPTTSGAVIRTKYFYPVSVFGQLKFTGVTGSDRVYFAYFYDKNLNFIERNGISSTGSTSIPNNAYFMKLTYGFTSASGTTVSSYGFDNLVTDYSIEYKSPVRVYSEGATGLAPIELNWGYYIPIAAKTVIDIEGDDAPLTSATWGCAIIDVSEGDVLTINSTGGSTARAFAFIDSEGNVLDRAQSNTTYTDSRRVAPKNSAKLLFNATRSDRVSYYDYTLTKKTNRIESFFSNECDVQKEFCIRTTPTFTIVQGNINTSNGADYSSSASSYPNRIKSQEYIPNDKTGYLHIKAPDGWWMYLFLYSGTTYDTYEGLYTWKGSAYLQGDYDIKIDSNYLRFTFVKSDGAMPVTPEDFEGQDFVFEFVHPADSSYASAMYDAVNGLSGCINYGYDLPGYRAENPSAGGDYVVGYERHGPVVTLNKHTLYDANYRIKISGDVRLGRTTTVIKGWNAELALISGHRYVATLKLISGTCLHDDSEESYTYVPAISFYKSGSSSISSTGGRIDNNTVYRAYITGDGSLYNMAINLVSDLYIIDNASFLVTLQDLTADIPVADITEDMIAVKEQIVSIENHDTGDVFICQNQLLRATDAIASGESIVIGTSGNAEAITLADYIKEIVTNASGIRADLDTLSSFGTDPDMALTKDIYRWNGPARVYSGRTISTTNGVIHMSANPTAGQRGFWCTNLNNGTTASNLSNSVPPATALEPISKLENADLMRVRFDQTSGDSVMTVYFAVYYCTVSGDAVTVLGFDRTGITYGVNQCVRLNIPETATHYATLIYESTAVAGEMDVYIKFTVAPTDVP